MIDMTPAEIERMLADAMIGRLCMADTDGTPYSIPLPFCWLNGSLYVRLALTGRKGDVLSRNDRVCFEIDSYTDQLREYGSVLVEGRLIEVKSLDEKACVKTANDAKYDCLRGGNRPGHGRATPLDALAMRKVNVVRVSGKKKEPTPAMAQ